jgi:hypothetical protein
MTKCKPIEIPNTLTDAIRGAEFFRDAKIVLPHDGCELLGILLRATATGFGTSNAEPAGHLALGNAANALRLMALENAGEPWLAAELMVAFQLLRSIGSELEQKYFANIHGGINPPN